MKLSFEAEPQVILAGLAVAKIAAIYFWNRNRSLKRQNGRSRARSSK